MNLHQGYIVFGLTILLTIISGTRSRPNLSTKEAEAYLSKYGYLANTNRIENVANVLDSNTFTEAIEDFQQFVGLNKTGILNKNTNKLITLSRCGLPDKERQKRYAIEGSKWLTKYLTYKIVNYPQNLKKEDVYNEIAKAFGEWSKYTDLTFTRTDSDQATIQISFVRGNHGDSMPFEGPGGNLAHGFYPKNGGDIHFDADENWTTNKGNGTDLYRVAVHEIGHTLGLNHSEHRSAIMAPVYNGNVQELHPDDIMGIKEIYGKDSKPMTYYWYPYGSYSG